MRKEYVEELKQLEKRMKEAEEFAKKLPFFSEKILNQKLTGNEEWINFGSRYKDIYFNWNINRGLYVSGSRRYVSNYKGKSYSKHLFNIYINTYSMFNHHAIRVDEVADKCNVFFYDKLNSTFYATDEQIMPLLEELNTWYIGAKKENIKLMAETKRKDAEKKLKEAQELLENLGKDEK